MGGSSLDDEDLVEDAVADGLLDVDDFEAGDADPIGEDLALDDTGEEGSG